MRTVEWDYTNNTLQLIDQRILPGQLELVSCSHYQQVAEAIQHMVVRGAPAIGATAAFGLALAANQSEANTVEGVRATLIQAAIALQAARPTAVNLGWALNKVLRIAESNVASAQELRQLVLAEAQRIADQDIDTNRRMAEFGAGLLNDGDTVIHHCNTGALAAVDWGTALGVIRLAHEQGKQIHVLVDETRPRLQGSRLTAWELEQYGIPYEIISDGSAGYFLHRGQVDKVFFGADRVAANGDVANKIGTYMLALAANDNGVPVYCVAPRSTIDLSLESGDLIPIEERGEDEVLNLQIAGVKVSPEGAHARNPAFDITPHRLLTAIVTEGGVVYPPFGKNISTLFSQPA
jgi:methylthioribose-1-phosphate isomerase